MWTQVRWSLAALSLCVPWLVGCGVVGSPGGGTQEMFAKCADPKAEAQWQEARRFLSSGEDQAALNSLLVVTRACPDLVRAHLAYQDLCQRLGGAAQQSMVDFYTESSATPKPADSPVARYLRARLADTAYAQSNALDQILAEHPKFAWGYLSLGRVLRGQGRFSEALLSFQKALNFDPLLMEARLERAQMLRELGRDLEAATDYQGYLRDRPSDNAVAIEYVSLLLYRLGWVDQARAQIDRLRQAGDTSVALRMDYAASLWLSKSTQAAIEAYLEILRDAPETSRAALNIGLIYYEVLPVDEASRRRYWPQARAAFTLFMGGSAPADGHEQFERTWAVPYRLKCISNLIGPPSGEASIEDLRWGS